MKKLILSLLLAPILHISAFAQEPNVTTSSITGEKFTIDENSKIVDKETGRRIPYQKFQELTKNDVNAYRLEAQYDEFGEIASFKFRPATAEERLDNRTYGKDLTLRPKTGEIMPLFVMKGLDGKTYRSTDLKGNIVVLSFWLQLRKPFWHAAMTQKMQDILKPYLGKSDFISLGTLDESRENLEKFVATQPLPFIPVPKSYTFSQKFAVTASPSFIVIDKSGNVAAYIEGSEFDELKNVLEKLTK
jgi:peroxiredoxin